MKIMKLNDKATVPQRATKDSAGYDLCALFNEEININETIKVKTGIAIELPKCTAGMIYARSGLSTKFGICLANGVGVVDCDYRGEIIIALRNSSDKAYCIKAGERIAQLVVTPILCPEIELVETLSQSERGVGGFGSTGK